MSGSYSPFDGLSVPIMAVTPKEFAEGYDEILGNALGWSKPLVTRKRFRMIWRREDGNYVVVDPAAEFAKHFEARVRLCS